MSGTLTGSEQKRRSDDGIIEPISDKYEFGRHDFNTVGQAAKRGPNEDVVRCISEIKNEPEWILGTRLRELEIFERRPIPVWGLDLSSLDFDQSKYFACTSDKVAQSWDDLSEDIKEIYDRLGIPEAEHKRSVDEVAAQYEPEVVYYQIREGLGEQGVIFLDTGTELKGHPGVLQEYFGEAVPARDDKFAVLNAVVQSEDSFIHVPRGIQYKVPLQAHFCINTESMGQFERTLAITGEGVYVHYVEGCTVPIYKSDFLHTAIVEMSVKKNTWARYTAIQNWSDSVLNLVIQCTIAEEGVMMEWVGGNIGSRINMKYPSVYLTGPHVQDEALPITLAGKGQYQDTGTKMIHFAPNTSLHIANKSISRQGGCSAYRGLITTDKKASGSKPDVLCDTLSMDTISRSGTYPCVDVRNDKVEMGHEAIVFKVSEDQLFYLTSRGSTETEAISTIVRSFVKSIAKELLMRHALGLNRSIELRMEGLAG